jgi:hypothetical protein
VFSFVAIAFVLHLFAGRNVLVFFGGIVLTFGGCLFCRYLFFNDVSDFAGIVYEGFRIVHLQFVPQAPASFFMTLVFLYLIGKSLMRWFRSAYGNQSYKFKVLASFMWMFVICVTPVFIYANRAFAYLPILAIPASILLAYYFSEERITKQMKVEFIVLLLSVAVNQFACLM